jgi:hypothetical protein
MNSITREFTPKTNKPYLTKTYFKYRCFVRLSSLIFYINLRRFHYFVISHKVI